MNRNSNIYTIIYAAVMVIVVAAILAYASISLSGKQTENINNEKKMNILASINKGKDAKKAPDKNKYIDEEYTKYIVESYCVDVNGNKTSADAFSTELESELKKKNKEERNLPVFVGNDGGSKKYIFPVRGPGLWGPLWGYVSLDDDFNTVFGAVFDHKGETPGLGAEISTEAFQKQFIGKKVFDGNRFVGIKVVKPGNPATNHTVDGISGGTITSEALGTMIIECLRDYEKFFQNQKLSLKVPEQPVVTQPADSTGNIPVQPADSAATAAQQTNN